MEKQKPDGVASFNLLPAICLVRHSSKFITGNECASGKMQKENKFSKKYFYGRKYLEKANV